MPNFATAFNLSQAAAGVSEKALLVLPMVLLIIAREIDLSVASILALCQRGARRAGPGGFAAAGGDGGGARHRRRWRARSTGCW